MARIFFSQAELWLDSKDEVENENDNEGKYTDRNFCPFRWQFVLTSKIKLLSN